MRCVEQKARKEKEDKGSGGGGGGTKGNGEEEEEEERRSLRAGSRPRQCIHHPITPPRLSDFPGVYPPTSYCNSFYGFIPKHIPTLKRYPCLPSR